MPRQAGLADCEARVVFEPEYRTAEAVRGLEEFEYVWLVWLFHLVDGGGEFRPLVLTEEADIRTFRSRVRGKAVKSVDALPEGFLDTGEVWLAEDGSLSAVKPEE